MSRSVPAYPPSQLPSVHPQGTWADPGGQDQEDQDPLTPLTPQEAAFVWAYLGEAKGNASRALAIARGTPLAPGQTADPGMRACAYNLVTKTHVKAAINALLLSEGMSRIELLSRVADHARGVPPDCWTRSSDGDPILDEAKLREHGLLHLIVGYDSRGRAKLADPLRAAELLARLGGYLSPDVSVGVRFDFSALPTETLRAMLRTGSLTPDRV